MPTHKTPLQLTQKNYLLFIWNSNLTGHTTLQSKGSKKSNLEKKTGSDITKLFKQNF